MVRLYITRHGQTVWNTQKRMQGWFDSPLTLQGQETARALGGRLAKIPFRAIYTSPSGRTVHTTKLICDRRQIPIFSKPQLKEINVGEWQGMTDDEIRQQFPEQYNAYYHDTLNYSSVEGENFQEVLDRALVVIKDICAKYDDDDDVLIVTHAVVKKLLLAHFNKLTVASVWDPPYIHGTSLSIVDLNKEGQASIQLLGDTAHLSQ